MFIISLKSKRLRRIALLVLIAVFVGVGGLLLAANRNAKPVVKQNGLVYRAQTGEVAFLAQFGWTVSEEPLEVKETVIPEQFDETYQNYNELQKQQGLDLQPFQGERVKAWSYEITNYPAKDASDGVIRATLLVKDGVVIGGDVSSTALGGFMHGFSKPS